MKKMMMLMVAALVMAGVGFVDAKDGDKEKECKKPKMSKADMFKSMDGNSDGFLSADEFASKAKCEKSKAKMQAKFAKMDKDGDSKLSKDEMCGPGKKCDKNKKGDAEGV